MDYIYNREHCPEHPGHAFDPSSVETTYSNNSGYDHSIVINGPVGNLHQHAPSGIVRDQPRRQIEDINRHFRVPHRLSSIYTGRETLLDDLKKFICPPKEHDFPQMKQKIAFVHGMAGSGKTQLCVKVAYDTQKRFRSVFWVDVSSPMTAREGLEDIIRCVGEANPCSSATIKAGYALATYQAPWLLVLDNANSLNLDIHQYLPNTHRGSVIVISTNPTLRHIAPDAAFAVNPMSTDDAGLLFAKASRLNYLQDKDLVFKVIKQLDCLPLAIVQAASAMTFKRLSLKELSASLSRAKHAMLDAAEDNAGLSIGHLPVFVTYDVKIQSLRTALAECPQKIDDTLELFNVLAFLGKGGTPVRLFPRAWKAFNKLSTSCRVGVRLPRVLTLESNECRHRSWNDERFWTALNCLEVFGLVQVGERESELGGQQILVHDLVHSWARYRQQADKSNEQRFQVLALTIIGLASQESHGVWRLSLLLQLRSCLSKEEDDNVQGLGILHSEEAVERFGKVLKKLSPIMHASVASLLFDEMPKVAESLLKSAYERVKATSNEGDSAVVFVLESLRDCNFSLSNFREVLMIDRKLIKAQSKVLGDLHVVTMMRKARVTLDRLMLGDFKVQRKLLNQVLDVLRKPSEEYKTETAKFMMELHRSLGRLRAYPSDPADSIDLEMRLMNLCSFDQSIQNIAHLKDSMDALWEVRRLEGTANSPAAFSLAKATYVELCGILGEEHPMANFFYTLANSVLLDLSMETTMSRWLGEAQFTSIEYLPDSSLLSSFSRRYGIDHPKTLNAMVQLALFAKEEKAPVITCTSKMDSVMYNSNHESVFSLLSRARALAKSSKEKYGTMVHTSISLRITLAMALAANVVEKDNQTLSSLLLNTAVKDAAELLSVFTTEKGVGSVPTRLALSLLSGLLFKTSEHLRAAETLGQAIGEDFFHGSTVTCSCNRIQAVNIGIGAYIYMHTMEVASSGDESAMEALVRIAQRTYLRSQYTGKSPILGFFGCAEFENARRCEDTYIDIGGFEELASYWWHRGQRTGTCVSEMYDDAYEVPSFGRVVHTVTEFITKSTLWVASGFVWEDWLDDETFKSDPFRPGREVVQDWFKKSRLSSLYRSIPTLHWDKWRKEKLKRE